MKTLLISMLVGGGLAAAATDEGKSRAFYRPYGSVDGGRTIAYTVQLGETLFDIAERFLGDPYQAEPLAKRNKIRDPLRPAAGSVIQLPAPRLSLRYAVQKLVTKPSGADVVPVTGSAKLSAGDRFQVWLAANCDGYLYVFGRKTGGEMNRLFPSGERKTARVRRFSEYLVPREGWFRMDDEKGDEELWVLVSLDPLTDLEADLITAGVTAVPGGKRGVVENYFDGKKLTPAKGIVIDDGSGDSDGSEIVTSPLDGGLVLAHRIRIARQDH